MQRHTDTRNENLDSFITRYSQVYIVFKNCIVQTKWFYSNGNPHNAKRPVDYTAYNITILCIFKYKNRIRREPFKTSSALCRTAIDEN